MNLIFTDHSKERMKQRNIRLIDIKNAFKNPTIIKSSYPPTELIQKITNKGTLEIIYKKSKENFIIITLYYL